MPRAKLMAVIVLGLALVWLVVARSLPTHLAAQFPEAARVLQPDNAVALMVQADRLLVGDAPSGADVREAGALLRRALVSDPVNAGVLRRLGDISADSSADAFMEAAARVSLHESVALHRTLEARLETGDTAGALRLADALLRTRPDLVEGMAPTVARLAQHVPSRDLLVRVLASNPPGRPAMLAAVTGFIADPHVTLALLTGLEQFGTPATAQEINAFLNLLMRERFYELAHYAWLQFLPAEDLARVRPLFNGDFAAVPSGAPFDWTIVSGRGVVSEIARHSDDARRRALRLTFGEGQVSLGDIVQTVALPEGAYEMTGRQRVMIGTRRGLQWSVMCAGNGRRIGESDAAIETGGWVTFTFSFAVSAQDCTAQHVRLIRDDRVPSDPFVTGTAWYSDLAITRR